MHWLDERDRNRIGETVSADDIKSMRTNVINNVPKNDQELYLKCLQVMNLLKDVGFPQKVLTYALAQVMHETGNFRSNLYTKGNNLSGIKWTKNDKYASGQMGAFAVYPNQSAWAKRYKEVLSQGPARPIDTVSAAQFGNALRANKYFLPSEDTQYTAGFNNALRKYAALYKAYHEKVNYQKPVVPKAPLKLTELLDPPHNVPLPPMGSTSTSNL